MRRQHPRPKLEKPRRESSIWPWKVLARGKLGEPSMGSELLARSHTAGKRWGRALGPGVPAADSVPTGAPGRRCSSLPADGASLPGRDGGHCRKM